MKKVILSICFFALTAFMVACEKENTAPIETKVEVASTDSEDPVFKDFRTHLDNFPSQNDREKELRRLMTKYGDLSERDSCFDAAWAYGTQAARKFTGLFPEVAILSTPEYMEWFFMNEYYEEHCE